MLCFWDALCLRAVCTWAYKDKQVRVHARDRPTSDCSFSSPANEIEENKCLPSSTLPSSRSQALSFKTVSDLPRRPRSVFGVLLRQSLTDRNPQRLYFNLLTQGINEFPQLSIRSRHTDFALVNVCDSTRFIRLNTQDNERRLDLTTAHTFCSPISIF